MLRSLNLLFSPGKEWEKLAVTPPHPLSVVLFTLIPVMLIGFGIEGWGLLRMGEQMSDFGHVQLPEQRIVKYILFYGIASLIVIVVGAQLLHSVGQSFNLTAGFGACLALMGAGYSPILLLRAADAFPQVNTWICWGVGVALGFRILYHGVALWLKPEQTKGFGLFLVSLIYTVVLSGLVHFASIEVLHGRFLKNVHITRFTSTVHGLADAASRGAAAGAPSMPALTARSAPAATAV